MEVDLDRAPTEPASISGTSGDPLLKRLVDLADLGFSPRLTLLSNGTIISGTLVSPSTYRTALAESIRGSDGLADAFGTLDSIVAAAIDIEDPVVTEAAPWEPEPRFIHLSDVRLGGDPTQVAPFLRIRLPAVSAFWLTTSHRGDEGEAG